MNLFSLRKKINWFSLFCILVCFLCFSCRAEAVERQKDESATVSDVNVFLYPITLFRQYLSGADGDRCSMYPSCSRYAMDAVKKHGGVMGWIMTCDRLMRCGRDEVRYSPLVQNRNRIFTHDPVENNDFWWE